jgi:membrane protein implicated in regulation of membrane protease activity
MDATFFNDPAALSLIAGLALLRFDTLVLGLSPMMFFALAAVLTSSGLYASGWRPSLIVAAALIAALGLLLTFFGKVPLQQFQNANIREDDSSDLIGRELTTTQPVTKAGGAVYWSGVEWQARLAESAALERAEAGARMRVTKVDNLALILTPAE